MEKKILALLAIISFILIACGQNQEPEINFLDPIMIEVTTVSELAVQEELLTQALVTQNSVAVADADEVVFEIWQHGNPDSYLFLEATAKGEGIYEVVWKADEEGVYYLYYHVTARGMHRMEKRQLVIGDVDVDEILATPDEQPNRHMN